MDTNHGDSEQRAILMRKLMTICPICGKLIFGRDLDFSKITNGVVDHWPVCYRDHHSHKNFPAHSLDLLIDANFSVREVIAPDTKPKTL